MSDRARSEGMIVLRSFGCAATADTLVLSCGGPRPFGDSGLTFVAAGVAAEAGA